MVRNTKYIVINTKHNQIRGTFERRKIRENKITKPMNQYDSHKVSTFGCNATHIMYGDILGDILTYF